MYLCAHHHHLQPTHKPVNEPKPASQVGLPTEVVPCWWCGAHKVKLRHISSVKVCNNKYSKEVGCAALFFVLLLLLLPLSLLSFFCHLRPFYVCLKAGRHRHGNGFNAELCIFKGSLPSTIFFFLSSFAVAPVRHNWLSGRW